MKLHGKILQHYLHSGSPDKEGYLFKKGEVNTSYQKRWFTLKGNLLFYRERRSEREASGVIVLERCIIQLCDSDELFAFSISFTGDSDESSGLRTYKFSAEDQASQESWVKALHSAQHGFLNVLVQDLHQQYLEAAREAGVEPVDMSSKQILKNSQKPQTSLNSSSVFYAPTDPVKEALHPPLSKAKQTAKRSPKLWPKRNTHDLTLTHGEWEETFMDFHQLHEQFGQEVRKLVAEWCKRKRERERTEGDLIDLG